MFIRLVSLFILSFIIRLILYTLPRYLGSVSIMLGHDFITFNACLLSKVAREFFFICSFLKMIA
jgi:hypothetical protein